MPSHFSTIGLPLSSQADYGALANRVGPLATPIEVPNGVYWRWVSDCGAEVWLQTNTDNELVGMTPFFGGSAHTTVRLTNRVVRQDDSPLEGAFHAWADPDQSDPDSGAYPFVFDVVDFDRLGDIALPTIAKAQIAAFAHEVSVYQTVHSYNESQTGELKFASQSFIPSGLFANGGESAEPPNSLAFFTGHIIATELKTNSLTRAQYYWALVETLGGCFDVVIDPELCDASPAVGGVISGSFWLCGRLID